MVWLRNLFLLLVAAVLALLVNALLGGQSGWWVFTFCTLALLTIHLRNLARALAWSQQLDRSPPTAAGSWGETLTRLHRFLRRRERELSESRETLHQWLAAAQALPDGVVVLDSQLQIEWCNREACRLLGLRFPADRGNQLLNLVRSPEFVVYAQSNEWSAPTVVPAPGSTELTLRVQFVPYGREQRLLVVRDVTQTQRIENMRREFVANVSHELRTPLTVLAGFLETLDEAPDHALSPEQTRRYLSMMRDQAGRMQNIVSDLLTLSTLESTRMALAPGAASVPALLASVREQAEALSAGAHPLTWQVAEEVDIEGVASELSSAFTNLVTNAVRYTPPGGRIEIRWQATAEGGAEFVVIDAGEGIAPKHIDRLTERFYRVDRGRSRASGGTGLGLAITRRVALRHDAELAISSELGVGSTFRLVFPAERRWPRFSEQAPAPQAPTLPTAPLSAGESSARKAAAIDGDTPAIAQPNGSELATPDAAGVDGQDTR